MSGRKPPLDADDREGRLSEALRANLRRRKSQAKARKSNDTAKSATAPQQAPKETVSPPDDRG